MVEKWDLPPGPPPFWLDPLREVTANPPKLQKGDFIIRCILALLALDCTIDQAFGVASNVMVETGWGRFYRAWNLGGWKITRATSVDSTGVPRQWWRAPGNKSSNDPPWCFYRAFTSLEAFFAEWLVTFVPKPGTAPKSRYKKTGEQFWAGEPWFDDLIAAGYKGAVTQRHPEKSIQAHEQINHVLTIYWAQYRLGVKPDGDFGPKSKAACRDFQQSHGLKETGLLNEETISLLFDSTSKRVVTWVADRLRKDGAPDVSKEEPEVIAAPPPPEPKKTPSEPAKPDVKAAPTPSDVKPSS